MKIGCGVLNINSLFKIWWIAFVKESIYRMEYIWVIIITTVPVPVDQSVQVRELSL